MLLDTHCAKNSFNSTEDSRPLNPPKVQKSHTHSQLLPVKIVDLLGQDGLGLNKEGNAQMHRAQALWAGHPQMHFLSTLP